MNSDLEQCQWHPSGQTPVHDEDMNLVGYTTLKLSVRSLRLTRSVASIEAMRMLLETADGSRHWIYWVYDGDPTDMPEFVRIH